MISFVNRNPIGRTGMTGRGLLGKWGPNHAVDPVVTWYIIVFLIYSQLICNIVTIASNTITNIE